MAKNQKIPLKLVVNIEEPGDRDRMFSCNDGYFHIHVSVYPDVDREKVYVRDEDCNGWCLDSLRLTSQGNKGCGKLYGFEVEYREMFSARLPKVERMVKTLRAIDKKLRKTKEQWGWPGEDFTAHVLHFANAVGAKRYELRDFGFSCDKNGYSTYDVHEDQGRLRGLAQRMVERWGTGESDKEVLPKQARSA